MNKLFDAVYEEVKANQRKLESCAQHLFVIPLNRMTKKEVSMPEAFCYWKCYSCGGYVDSLQKKYYDLGLKHARASTFVCSVCNNTGYDIANTEAGKVSTYCDCVFGEAKKAS